MHRGGESGESAGRSTGARAGGSDADEELAAIEAEEAAAAAAAEAAAAEAAAAAEPSLEYTAELPHGEPGYLLPPEERSLSCVGYDADTGECIGD